MAVHSFGKGRLPSRLQVQRRRMFAGYPCFCVSRVEVEGFFREQQGHEETRRTLKTCHQPVSPLWLPRNGWANGSIGGRGHTLILSRRDSTASNCHQVVRAQFSQSIGLTRDSLVPVGAANSTQFTLTQQESTPLSTMASGDQRSGQENSSDQENEPVTSIDWTAENEVRLFYAMKNRKPVGIDRNFQMILINASFNEMVHKQVPSSVLWEHLESMYDMEALNDNHSPASSIVDEKDFALPSDFDDLIKERCPSESQEEEEPQTAPAVNKAPAKATPKVESVAKTTKTRTASESEAPSNKARVKSEESKITETEEISTPAVTTTTSSATAPATAPTSTAATASTPKSSVKRRVTAKTDSAKAPLNSTGKKRR